MSQISTQKSKTGKFLKKMGIIPKNTDLNHELKKGTPSKLRTSVSASKGFFPEVSKTTQQNAKKEAPRKKIVLLGKPTNITT